MKPLSKVLLILLLYCLSPSIVNAQQPYSDEAMDIYNRAMEAYEAGNQSSAISLLERAAELGVAEANLFLGTYYLSDEDFEKAGRHLRTAWERNQSGEAAYYAGILYLEGLGVSKSAKNAVLWLERAAQKTDDYGVLAHYALGTLYINGAEGMPKNDQLAIQWLEKIADVHPDAKFNLATIYLNGGENVEQDFDKGLSMICAMIDYEYKEVFLEDNPQLSCDTYNISDLNELQEHVTHLLWMAGSGFTDIRGIKTKSTAEQEIGGSYYPGIIEYESTHPIGRSTSQIKRIIANNESTLNYAFWGYYLSVVEVESLGSDTGYKFENSNLKEEFENTITSTLPEDWIKITTGTDGDIYTWKECKEEQQGHMVRLDYTHNETKPQLTVGAYDTACPGSVSLPARKN